MCSAGIYVRHNDDWPADFEKALKGLKEVAPGLVVPRNVVDLEVPKIGRIYLDNVCKPRRLRVYTRAYRVKIAFPTGLWVNEIEVGHYRVLEYRCGGGLCERFLTVQGPRSSVLLGIVM